MKMKTLAVLATLFATTLFAQSGSELFTKNCSSCHANVLGVNVDEQGKYSYIAPAPYITDLITKLKSKTKNEEEFTAFIQSYINNPDKRKSLYGKNALRVFGIMPTLKGALTEDEIRVLAKYLYASDKRKRKVKVEKETKVIDPREKLFDKHCASCHKESMGVNINLQGEYTYICKGPYIADLIKKIKQETRSKNRVNSKEDFTSFIKSYINDPSKRKSLYGKRAIKEFGLMPSLKGAMTDEESTQLSNYLYERY